MSAGTAWINVMPDTKNSRQKGRRARVRWRARKRGPSFLA